MNIGNVGHRGDVIWTAIMLSKIPGPHTLYVNLDYVPEFRDLLEGMDTAVEPLTQKPADVQDSWIANGRFPQLVYPRDCTDDIMDFVRRYMNLTAAAGRDAMPDAESMLIDFPAIERECPALPFDILAINANPQSGQCPHYSGSEFDGLLLQLVAKGHRVLATNPTTACPWGNFSFAQIGNLSTRASLILGVATGPMWATFNIWSQSVRRYIFLDPFRLNFGLRVPIQHFQNAEQMRVQLVAEGVL